MSSFKPTSEQERVLEAFETKGDIVVDALAGTGKTTTLKLLANSNKKRRGLYLCYNKATAVEAKASFPSSVECTTIHSLAYRAVGHKYRDRLNAKRIPPWEMASWLNVTSPISFGELSLSPMSIAGLTLDTIRNFCYSDRLKPEDSHVPWVPGLTEYRNTLVSRIMPLARQVWKDLQQPKGYCKFDHDHYLKIYALTEPTLKFDYILGDEFQDANALTLQLFKAQAHAQLVSTGDENQQLYGWRGSQNAMRTLLADHRLSLTKSFRFGHKVAEEGQKWLSLLQSDLQLEGFDQIESEIRPLEDPDVIICRTNAQVICEAVAAQERGISVAIAGGTNDIEKFAKAAEKLMAGQRTLHHDLAAFSSWVQVREYSRSPEGRDLATLVGLIDKYGTDRIIQIANSSVSEASADLTVTTGHKAKGREWDKVKVAPDFSGMIGLSGEISRESMMLAYVVCTRAQEILDTGGLSFVDMLQPLPDGRAHYPLFETDALLA